MKDIKPSPPVKDEAFLRQIPEWEGDYRTTDERMIHYTPEAWKTAKATYTDHDLRILDEPVMEDWEDGYMQKLADIATSGGGVILEVGYGMGISARYIQARDIARHVIIEANQEVASVAMAWAAGCTIQTDILEGLWQDRIGDIPDASLDGILFDSYPLTEMELYQNHFCFFSHAYRKLKAGGVLTYYSDESQWFSDVHMQRLLEAGFGVNAINGDIVPVDPPPSCEYWKSKTMLAPIVRKVSHG